MSQDRSEGWAFSSKPFALANLKAFAKKEGKPWTDPVLQAKYMASLKSLGKQR